MILDKHFLKKRVGDGLERLPLYSPKFHVWTNFSNFSKRLPVKDKAPGVFYSEDRNIVIYAIPVSTGKGIIIDIKDIEKGCINPTAYILAIIDRMVKAHLRVYITYSYKDIPVQIKYPDLFKIGEREYSFTGSVSTSSWFGREQPMNMSFQPVNPEPLGKYKLKHGEIVRK